MARALPLRAGRRRARERPGVSRQRLSLAPAARGRGSRSSWCRPRAEGWPDEARLLERLEDPRVRALAVSLVQFSNGYRVDLARALARPPGAPAPTWWWTRSRRVGQLPVDLAATPVDVLACGGQKWLLSPWGSGFVYVRRELIARAEPAGHRLDGVRGHRRLHPAHELQRHAAGRRPAVRADHAAVPGLRGDERVARPAARAGRRADRRRTCSRLHAPVLAWAERSGARVASPLGAHGSGILCLAPDDVGEAFRRLKAARIICSLREGAIRLSPHAYNTVEEMERVVDVLEGDAVSRDRTDRTRPTPERTSHAQSVHRHARRRLRLHRSLRHARRGARERRHGAPGAEGPDSARA